MYKLFFQLLSQGVVWLAIVLLILMSLLPDIIFMLIARHFYPSETQKVQVTVLHILNGMCANRDSYIAVLVRLFKPSARVLDYHVSRQSCTDSLPIQLVINTKE